MDIHNFSDRLDRIADYIRHSENGWNFSDENKMKVLKFYQQLVAEGISAGRIIKYLYFLRDFEKILKKEFEKANKDNIVEIVSKIEKRKDWSEWTKRDFKNELKRFYRWLRGTEPPAYPEEVSWIRTKKIKNPRFPEGLLTEEDVEKMINAASNPRDRAFIHALYESASRPGELLTCKMKSIEFDDYGCVMIVFGKTGMRRLRLINSASDLKKWRDAHPSRNNPEAPLWIATKNLVQKNAEPVTLGYNTVIEIIRNVAAKAGIKKRVNPYVFRHSRATFLSKYLSDAELKNFLGHTQESRATAVYVHLSGKDVDEKLLKIYGIKKESLKELNKPKPFIKCPRCKEINNFDEDFCVKCWLPLNPKAAELTTPKSDIGFYQTIRELQKRHPEVDKNVLWEALSIHMQFMEKFAERFEKEMRKNETSWKEYQEFNKKMKERYGKIGW